MSDGGGQEYNTARSAVLAVFPNAKVIGKCLDKYPIEVKIMRSDGTIIWHGSQRNLFSKYASKRQESINQIKQALQKYKD